MLRRWWSAPLAGVIACGGATSFVRSAGAPRAVAEEAPTVGATLTEAEIQEVFRTVEQLRGLRRKTDMSVRVVSASDFATFVSKLKVGVEVPAATLNGVCDDATSTLVLRQNASREQLEVGLAHEFEHALQNQNFGRAAVRESAAEVALREGDATFVGFAFAAKRRGLPPLRTAQLRAADDVFVDAGFAAELAYIDGTRFVAAIQRAGGFALVNRVFTNPPQHTAEILHPQEYLDGFVEAPPPPWPDAEDTREGSTGEAAVIESLMSMGVSDDEAREAASGWRGGDLVALHDPSRPGRQAYLWRIAASPNERLSSVLSRFGTVRRRGDLVALAAGTDHDAAIAERAVSLPSVATTSKPAPPFGPRTIPPAVRPAMLRVPWSWERSGEAFVARAWGLRVPVGRGLEASERERVLVIRDGMSWRSVYFRRGESASDWVNVVVARSDDPKKKATAREVHTTLGAGVEVEFRHDGALTLAYEIPVCDGRARLVFQFDGLEDAEAPLLHFRRWLSGIDARASARGAMCEAFREDVRPDP